MVDKPQWQLILPGDKVITIRDDEEQEESKLPLIINLRGILKALRLILEVPEGESILTHAAITMRKRRFVGAAEVGSFIAENQLDIGWDKGPTECVITQYVTHGTREWRSIKVDSDTSNLMPLMRALDKARKDLG